MSDEDKTDAEKLERVEREIARLKQEFDSLKAALGETHAVAWVDGVGLKATRSPTAFENATIKRLHALDAEIR